MLDDLFAQLRTASAPAEIEAIQNGIWQIWLTTDDVALDKLFEAGMRFMSAADYTRAIGCFDQLVAAAPHLAEAWNKRATAYYLRGDFRASLADIAETLRREPRHFGALWGQTAIFRQLGEPRRALRVLGHLAALCPHLPGLREQQLALREQLEDGSGQL